MLSNLIFYGIALVFGAALGLTLRDCEKRNPYLIAVSIILPVVWTAILANLDLFHTSSLWDLYNIEYYLPNAPGKTIAVLAMVPLFWAFSISASIFIEFGIWNRSE
ncbi:hypothetical protein MLD52_17940 [Puniceicoccaceae bacterium K14]|nr:hypothetical protein [Puniceicoccaceae bacterium K14]